MGTRTFAQVPPTASTIALNAYIYGYGGHSLVTPHAALKQLWWTDDRIEKKVTRSFVVAQIRGEERKILDKALAFGEGLTDDTYMEWILERARRLFLIMAEIGKPEQIFGLIDDSLDDDDLPFSLDTIQRLELSVKPDHRLNKKCYDTQFLYLLRQLKAGSHIDYGPNEHIPMEHVHKLPPAVPLQCWDRIHFPAAPEKIYLRRKFAFGYGDERDTQRARYFDDLAKAKYHKHEHICPVWASYTSGDAGYIISDFVPEHTLGTFIAQRLPYQFMRISASERPILILEWLHCLSDTLASLHHRGTYHGAIRPSNIVIDYDNQIAFSDVGVLRTFQKGKKVDKKEIGEYAAPEVYALMKTAQPHKAGATGAKAGGEDTSSSGGSSRSTSVWSAAPVSPISSPIGSPVPSGSPTKYRSFRNFSRHLGQQSEPNNATTALLPSRPTSGGATSLASIIATATSPITTITPSLPPLTPDDDSPHYSHAPWVRSSSPNTTPTNQSFSFPTASPFAKLSKPRTSSMSSSSAPTPTALTFSFPQDSLHKSSSTSYLPKLTSVASTISSSNSVPTTPLPEAADIFSLGCVYLDILTWLVKGRLTPLQRFRASPPPPGLLSDSKASVRSTRSARSFITYRTTGTRFSSAASRLGNYGSSGSSGGSGAVDPAFAANIESGKLELWMNDLRDESLKKLDDPKARSSGELANEAVWVNGVPELLALVKMMICEEPGERVSAREVRDTIENILTRGVGLDSVCCQGRVWETGEDDVKRGRKRGAGGINTVKEEHAESIDGNEKATGLGIHVRSRRVLDETIELSKAGGAPVRRRKISLPWKKK